MRCPEWLSRTVRRMLARALGGAQPRGPKVEAPWSGARPHAWVLFLDFDGVLHPYTQGSLTALPALEAVLRDRPWVGVVVSSNWRMSHSLAELRALFSDDMAPRVLDALPFEGPEREGDRQRLIERWLAQNPTCSWCALDDDARLFSPSCPWLVLTERSVGLTDVELAEIARRTDELSRPRVALHGPPD